MKQKREVCHVRQKVTMHKVVSQECGVTHIVQLDAVDPMHSLIHDDEAALLHAGRRTVWSQPGWEGIRHQLPQQALQQRPLTMSLVPAPALLLHNDESNQAKLAGMA